MTRIAVWGLGPHAMKNILPAIAQSDAVQIAGVCSRNAARRDDACRTWGGASWSTPEAMLRSADVDLVYLATPTGLHFEHGMQILAAGKHVLCEKSLTATAADTTTLIATARASQLLLHEAFPFQDHPRMSLLQAIVGRVEFGAPTHAYCSFTIPPLAQPGFRFDSALGGGALLDVGCYPLSLMRTLFGDEPVVTHAEMRSTSPGEVDSTGSACLNFGNGPRATVAWGYNQAYTAEMFVIGEHQSVYANRLFTKDTPIDSVIRVRGRDGTERLTDVPPAHGYLAMFDRVARALADPKARAHLYASAEAQGRLLHAVGRACS